MSNEDKYNWSPNDNIGRMIRKVPYDKPSPDLVNRIMAPLKPVRPSITRKLWLWFTQPVNLKLSPALLTGIALIIVLPSILSIYTYSRNPAVVETSMQMTNGVPVVFYYNEQDAKSVSLMGSFNNWDPSGHELTWNPVLNQWTLQLYLQPGKYDYVFLINGERVSADPDADLIHKDDFGNRNSVLFVKGNNGSQI